MAQSLSEQQSGMPPLVKTNKVGKDRPWEWVRMGVEDTRKTPVASIAYGLVFTIMGYALNIMVADSFHFILALAAGFLLVGPFLAIGLYDLSARLEKGEKPTLGHALMAWKGHGFQVFIFGLVLAAILAFWVRTAAVLFAVFHGTTGGLTVSDSIQSLFFTDSGLAFLAAFMLVGAVVAALVYVISVVAIPKLMDRDTDIFDAALTSVCAVRANPVAMVKWALIVAGFTFVGLITFFIGLAVTMPIIGHATWRAYRDLVPAEEAD